MQARSWGGAGYHGHGVHGRGAVGGVQIQVHRSQRLVGWALEEAGHGVERSPDGEDGGGTDLGQAGDGSGGTVLLCGGSMELGWGHTGHANPVGVDTRSARPA